MWWQLWNFKVWQMKFNRFLHPNELPQRIFLYLVRQLDWGQSKIGYFQFLKSIFRPKINLITLKMIFVLEYQTRRTTFSNNIFSFIQTLQILFSKNVPYFFRLSAKLSCKISECSFGCKTLLNFIKFHNFNHAKSGHFV